MCRLLLQVDKAEEAVRDLWVSKAAALAGKDAFDALYAHVAGTYGDHLPLLQVKLAWHL